MPRKGWTWAYTPGKDPRNKPSEATKAEAARRVNELIETTLKPNCVKPPPADPKFNYITGFKTKWHGRFFTITATYACPFPDALSPTFDVGFARLEYRAGDRYRLAYFRHTDKWQELFGDLSLDECLKSIREDPWFQCP